MTLMCNITLVKCRLMWRRDIFGRDTSRDYGKRGRYQEAQIAGSRARHVMEHLAEETVKHCIRACGARCLIRPSVLERVYRDLSFYVSHDNDDYILAMIGKSVLRLTHDPSIYKRSKPAITLARLKRHPNGG
jgi:alkylation response protein AidB-like acyl-CoA dehydrogenase